MTNQFKNPLFWCFVLLLGGMIIGGWGWDKNESTIPSRTEGADFMMISGVVSIVAGLIGFYILGNRKSK